MVWWFHSLSTQMLADCMKGADSMRVVWMILVNRALHGDKGCPFSSRIIRVGVGGGGGAAGKWSLGMGAGASYMSEVRGICCFNSAELPDFTGQALILLMSSGPSLISLIQISTHIAFCTLSKLCQHLWSYKIDLGPVLWKLASMLWSPFVYLLLLFSL